MADRDLRQLQRLYRSGAIGQNEYLSTLDRQGTFESFLEYYRVLEATEGLAASREEIIEAMARTFFADGWSYELEELGLHAGVSDYYYDCPPIPQEAYTHAEAYAKRVEEQIGASLPVYYHTLGRIGPRHLHKAFDPEQFGYLLVMSGLGHGVGLWEHFDNRLVDVPNVDTFYGFTLCAGCGDMFEEDQHRYECQGTTDDGQCYREMCDACAQNCNECGALLCPRCRENHAEWV